MKKLAVLVLVATALLFVPPAAQAAPVSCFREYCQWIVNGGFDSGYNSVGKGAVLGASGQSMRRPLGLMGLLRRQ